MKTIILILAAIATMSDTQTNGRYEALIENRQ
jgi:hypothetical protein